MPPFYTDVLEVAFASQPMSASPTWTNITPYLGDGTIEIANHGAADEFTEIAPTTLALPLDNSDGRFTQGLASSPYSPNVKLDRRIRYARIRYGVTYRRFDGHANGWPTQWVKGAVAYAETAISATDRLKRFGRPGELRSTLEEEILRDAATASVYYPLAEPQGAISAGNATKQIQPAAAIRQVGSGGLIEFAQGTGPGTDELSAPLFSPASGSPANGKYLEATPLGSNIGGNPGYTLEGWFRCDATTTRTIAALTNLSGVVAILELDSAGKLQARQTVPFLADKIVVSAGVVNDDRTHHGALVVSISGTTATMRLYLDGAEVGTAATWTVGSGNLSSYSRIVIGGNKTGDCFRGTLSHVAAHSSALSAARVLDHYNAGANGLAGERTDQRIARIADWIGIPSADRNLDTGDSIVSAQATSGRPPIEVMREVEKAEDGRLFVSGDGKLTFHNRSRRYNATPAVTLSARWLVEPLEFPGDGFGMVNDLTVTRSEDSGARVIDQASIDEYDLHRDSLEIPAVDDDALLAMAQWRVGNYATPRIRVPNVVVDIATLEQLAPSVIPALLAADISTKIRITDLPVQAPTSQVDLFIEGWTETITTPAAGGLGTWRIAFNTGPGDTSQIWQLGVAGFSELGVTTRIGP